MPGMRSTKTVLDLEDNNRYPLTPWPPIVNNLKIISLKHSQRIMDFSPWTFRPPIIADDDDNERTKIGKKTTEKTNERES